MFRQQVEDGEPEEEDEEELTEAPLPTETLQKRLHKTWRYAGGAAAEHAGTFRNLVHARTHRYSLLARLSYLLARRHGGLGDGIGCGVR